MSNFLEVTKQALGLAPIRPTQMDLKLLTDGLGRTLPDSGQYVGTAPFRLWGMGNNEQANAYSSIGTIFSIVTYILDAASTIPWNVYEIDKADNQAKVVAATHPLASLLYRPNPRQTWAALKRQCMGSYKVKGEFFMRRVRPAAGSRKGKTAELWCLVGQVDLLPATGLGEFDKPTAYRHTDILTGRVTEYPADEILHVKTWNPLNPHRGLSPIAAGNDDVTLARSGKESRGRQYQNQGPAGIVYSKPSGSGDNEQWTPEQATRVQNWFGSFFGTDRRRSGQIPIVSRELGYLQMGLTPVDLDMLAAIPYDKDALCDLWHFPGQLLNGAKGTTFNNMGEASRALYSRCVIPDEIVFKDELNSWLGAEYNDEVYINFETSHIPELQEDLKELVTTLLACPWMKNQDKMRRMNLPVDEDFPPYLIPSTYVTLQDLMDTPAGADAAAGAREVVN